VLRKAMKVLKRDPDLAGNITKTDEKSNFYKINFINNDNYKCINK
jgi:hypothetical protein